MIRGYLSQSAGRKRPFVQAHVTIPSLSVSGKLELLVDTGADSTLVGPADASDLGIDIRSLPRGATSRGVGGASETVSAEATLTFEDRSFPLTLRVLAPQTISQRRILHSIPSLLGRDVLSEFALFFEERTGRVLLLEPSEADALSLP